MREHVDEFGARRVIALEPTSWDGRVVLERLSVELVRNDLLLCHYDDFSGWAAGRKRLTMEDFYRWQRQRLGVLIDGGVSGPEPAGASGTSSMTTVSHRREMAGPGPGSNGSTSTTSTERKLAHSVLSSSMNIGLLHPTEVVADPGVSLRWATRRERRPQR